MGTLEGLKHLYRRSRSPRWRWLWLVAAAGVYGLTMLLPWAGATPLQVRTLAVFAVAAFLWGTYTLPLAVTGLVVLFLLPVTGVMNREATYAYFGNHAVFFILGAFILTSPVMRSGLSVRVALAVLDRIGVRPRRLVLALFWLSGMLSFLMSEHAVVVMLFPIVLTLIQAMELPPGHPLAGRLLLALAWGAVIGGTATLLGGARAPLALGILEKNAGSSIGFLQWAVWATPSAMLLLGVGSVLLIRRFPRLTPEAMQRAHTYLHRRKQALGPPTRREQVTGAILLFTILLWITVGDRWGLDTVAFLGVLLAFFTGVARWVEVEEDVNWGIFILYGSAISLSAALEQTGTAGYLVRTLFHLPLPETLFPVLLILLAMVLTELMSNAAAVAVLMPMALALAQHRAWDPRWVTLSVAVPAGLAFLLPVSTPALAIILGSGYLRPMQILREGLLLKTLSLIVFLMVAFLLWPHLGLEVHP